MSGLGACRWLVVGCVLVSPRRPGLAAVTGRLSAADDVAGRERQQDQRAADGHLGNGHGSSNDAAAQRIRPDAPGGC